MPYTSDTCVYAHTRVWDDNALAWTVMTQPLIETDEVTVAGSLAVSNWPATQAVTGTFWQATQPVSAVAWPLPTGAATQASLADVKTNLDRVAVTGASGSVSSSGNNTVITPSAGKRLAVSYLSYNPALAVEAAFRFGASGPLWLRNSLSAGAVVAKDFGDFRYVLGAVDEPLVLNLSVGVATLWNAFYREL